MKRNSNTQLRFEDVSGALDVWAIMFPRRDMTAAKLKVLKVSYFDALRHSVNRPEFFIAGRIAQNEAKWFPLISDILKHRNEAIRKVAEKQGQKAIADNRERKLSPKEEARGAELLELARQILSIPKNEQVELYRKMRELAAKPI